MAAIRAEMRRGVADRGIFDGVLDATSPPSPGEQLAPAFDPDDLTPEDFRFDDEDQAHERFMAWLRRQQEAGVLSVISREDNVYIRRALTDGDRWAVARLREAGFDVSVSATPAEAYAPRALAGGSLDATFDRPIPASTVRLLFQRNYNQLEGITTDTAQEIGEALSRGFAQGQNPVDIARDMADRIDKVGRNRATLLARHEVMYAHNESSKHRYRQQGVERVKVLGTNPCPQCQPYVGNEYPLNDIPHGGPPFHPNCVGCLAPVVT